MPVIRTFASHATVDNHRVHKILRRSAPFGVRPWIDEHDLFGAAGKSLRETIMAAINDPSCRSLSVFISEASVKSGWVNDEVGEALARLPDGFRVLPIALDPIDKLALPPPIEAALGKHGSSIDRLYLFADDRRFIERFAASVLDAGGLPQATEVVLALGHREKRWEASLPPDWESLPAIDLRLEYPVGHADFSPSDAEWIEIREGLDFLQRRMQKVERIDICGVAPLGLGAAIGTMWDRGTGVRLQGWNVTTRQAWSGELGSADLTRADGWSPETGRLVKAKREGNFFSGERATVAFLQKAEYEPEVRAWSAQQNPGKASAPLVIATWPLSITTAAEATDVLAECLGVIRWVRRAFTGIREIEMIATLPLPLVAFLAHQLRQVGTIRFYDQVRPQRADQYRLAVSWG